MLDAYTNNQHQEEIHQDPQVAESIDRTNEEIRPDVDPFGTNNNNTESNDGMEYDDRGQSNKRQLTTDSDSDHSASTRQTRLRPAPSLLTRRKVEKKVK